MLKKDIETKEKAIIESDKYFKKLQEEIEDKQKERQKVYNAELTEKQKENITVFNKVVITPKEYLDFVYNNANFRNYLQYTLVVKNMCKKIYFIKMAIIFIAIAISVLIGIAIGNAIISLIIGAILIIGSIVFVLMQKTGISYEEYYTKTMFKLMLSILPEYEFKECEKNTEKQRNTKNVENTYSRYYLKEKILTKEELRKHFDKVFDYYKENNTLLYSSPEARGGMCDLEIVKKVEEENKQTGKTETKDKKIFDGFYIKNNIYRPSNVLDEYVIEIREDESLFSALTEDTIHSVYKSEKEFTFNTEELNKALDCKIKYENLGAKAVDETIKFAKKTINSIRNKDTIQEQNIVEKDVDPVLILEKVITPVLEERLLYLRKRYNSFNMNLANSYISFNVDLNQTFFQRFQAKEIFGNDYKKHTEKVTFVKPTLFGNGDFEYYRQFPMLEKIFFIHYINLLYRFALKPNEVTLVENDVMNRFENEIAEVMSEKYSVFKEHYKDDIKQISDMVKDTISEIQAK